MGNKFHAKKVKIGEITFDSKKEADHYLKLKKLEESGKIRNLQLQVKYELIPPYIIEYEEVLKSGKIKVKTKTIERGIDYIADFVYEDEDGTHIVDVKGCRFGAAFQVYKIKKKLMLYRYNILIEEI